MLRVLRRLPVRLQPVLPLPLKRPGSGRVSDTPPFEIDAPASRLGGTQAAMGFAHRSRTRLRPGRRAVFGAGEVSHPEETRSIPSEVAPSPKIWIQRRRIHIAGEDGRSIAEEIKKLEKKPVRPPPRARRRGRIQNVGEDSISSPPTRIRRRSRAFRRESPCSRRRRRSLDRGSRPSTRNGGTPPAGERIGSVPAPGPIPAHPFHRLAR